MAYAFHYRGRACGQAIPELIRFLSDPERVVRQEAADALGRVVSLVRNSDQRKAVEETTGEALLKYVESNPSDSLIFAIASLGETRYKPARPYLARVARRATGHVQAAAQAALVSLERE